jgi:RimJ/RimL family protein N-acetyltransferase
MHHSFKKAIERLQAGKDKGKIFLVGKLEGKVVGFVGVRVKNENLERVGDVGLSVHPDYWGRGFGTSLLKAAVEKAKAEGFSKLELEILRSNKAMLRVAEKVGFNVKSIKKGNALETITMELTL